MFFKAADAIRHCIETTRQNIRPSSAIRLWLISFCIVAMIFTAVFISSKPVTIFVDGKKISVHTFSQTVGDLLAEQHISLGWQDRVLPVINSPVARGEEIKIFRAVPVKIILGDKVLNLFTTRKTVAGVLKENGIVIGAGDLVEPSLSANVKANLEIKVDRVTIKTEVSLVPLPFSTRQEQSPDLFRGVYETLQSGKPGLERQVWQVSFRDGKVLSQNIILTQVITKPEDKVILVGSLDEVSRGGNVIRFEKVLNVVATAYTYTGHDTASGTVPGVGTIAVDPRVIPLGTRLYVEGYGYCTALDTGGAIKGDRVDLFFPTLSEVYDWGVRSVRVFILK